jgi:hypothetical protein
VTRELDVVPNPYILRLIKRKRPAKPLLRRRCATPTLGE